MADINVERKGPSIWPWVIGLLVLALLIWAIAEMVDTDDEVAEVAEREEIEEVEEPPAAVPTPAPVTPEEEALEIETLLPLGPEDAGQMARIDGTVVGQTVDNGFWARTNDDVIFVRSDRRVQPGETVQMTGTLTPAPEQQVRQWADQARLTEEAAYEDWTVHDQLILDATAQPAMQPQPGQQPGQPMQPAPAPGADTIEGRY